MLMVSSVSDKKIGVIDTDTGIENYYTISEVIALADKVRIRGVESDKIYNAVEMCLNKQKLILGNKMKINQRVLESCRIEDDEDVIKVPYGVVAIGKDCFSNTACKEVILPNSVKWIEGGAFSYCKQLRGIHLPNQLQKIGVNAFCLSHLQAIEIPSTVRVLGANAFANCTDLHDVILNEGLTKIDDCAFINSELHGSLEIPSTVKKIGINAFYHTSLEGITFKGDDKISLSSSCFRECRNLKRIEWGSSYVDVLPCSCFAGCALEEIEVPNGVEVIDEKCFSYNKLLRSIKLPSSLKEIRFEAFEGDFGIEEVLVPNELVRQMFLASVVSPDLYEDLIVNYGVAKS